MESAGGNRLSNSGMKSYKDDEGRFHRDDGPALIYPHGSVSYYRHGKLHRDEEAGPAQSDPQGLALYFKDGLRHRESGPAAIYPDGLIEYYFEGQLHRADGPAIVYPDGSTSFYDHGRLLKTLDPKGREIVSTSARAPSKKKSAKSHRAA